LNAPHQTPGELSVIRIEAARVFIRALRVEAEVGVYSHEHGRRQVLMIDVELEVAPASGDHLADTLNYEMIADHARTIAARGHHKLIETFAERLARACLEDSRVTRARVRIEKPEALAPDADAGGAEIILTRTRASGA
jgi:7,8-dihydroneopterin aldolase/epimerase/oxygenase